MVADEIRKLREIQHVALIRDEEACVGSGKKGETLSAKMDALVAELDGESLAIYKRLQPKGRIFLSRFSHPKLMVPRLKATTPKEAMSEQGSRRASGCVGCECPQPGRRGVREAARPLEPRHRREGVVSGIS